MFVLLCFQIHDWDLIKGNAEFFCNYAKKLMQKIKTLINGMSSIFLCQEGVSLLKNFNFVIGMCNCD